MGKEWIAGLFALVGAFVGAYFTRQTQHQKWLLERRSEAFAKFFELAQDAHCKSSDLLANRALESLDRNIQILDAYLPVLLHARIVRLYLPRSLRAEFHQHVVEYWSLHTQPDLGDKRLTKMGQNLDKIQEMFENELSPHAWLRPWGRWFRRKRTRDLSKRVV